MEIMVSLFARIVDDNLHHQNLPNKALLDKTEIWY